MVDVYALAADLLTRAVAQLQLLGIEVPASQYVAPGDSSTIAWDGPAIQVNVDWLAWGQPGNEQSIRPTWPMQLHFAQFSIVILREAASLDDFKSPPVEAIQLDAKTMLADLAALQAALETIRAGCQQPGGWVGPGIPVVLGRVVPVGPMGAMMAALGSIQVVLA